MNETTKTTEYEMTEFGPMATKETITHTTRSPEIDVPDVLQKKTIFKGTDDTKVHNFSIHDHENSCIRAYAKYIGGCKSTKCDVMLTFGSTISVRGGNNRVLEVNGPAHIDVFVSQKQAEGLIEELTKAVKANKEIEDGTHFTVRKK